MDKYRAPKQDDVDEFFARHSKRKLNQMLHQSSQDQAIENDNELAGFVSSQMTVGSKKQKKSDEAQIDSSSLAVKSSKNKRVSKRNEKQDKADKKQKRQLFHCCLFNTTT